MEKPLLRKHEWGEEYSYHGFRRVNYRGEGWIFYISGFNGPPLADGSDSIGNVLLFGGGTEACKMDMKGRIRIAGRWFNEDKWNH